MKICLLGNNLTNFLLANVLLNKNITVDIISQKPLLTKQNIIRTIAISNENYKFLRERIKGVDKLGWPTANIKIYSEKNISSELFEFKNKNQKNFYLFKYNELFNILKKNKLIKSTQIKNYNLEALNKRNYNLIINSEQNNPITKKFFQKKIEKDYKTSAHTAIIDHADIQNNTAMQIFTKNGPLAFLPLSNKKTSIVFSFNSIRELERKKFIEIVQNYNLKYKIKKFSDIETFNIRFFTLRNYIYKNVLSFGDLIHKVHPLAGQGFNMTIRDVKSLSNILESHLKLGISDGEIIGQKFQEKNKHLNFMYGIGIDSINSFFSFDNKLNNILSDPIFKLLKNNKLLNKYATLLTD